MKQKPARIKVFTRILLFAIALGVIEDLIAITLATESKITPTVLLIIIPVAIVFAIIGEFVVNKTKLICDQVSTK